MTTHTAQCNEAQAAVVAWKEAHPNYCHKCHGAGVTGTTWDNELCEYCAQEGRCPVCGHQHGENWCEGEYETCESCGHVIGEYGCPEVDCDCGREEEEAQAEAARILWESQPVELDDDFFRRAEDEFQASRDRGIRSSFRGRD